MYTCVCVCAWVGGCETIPDSIRRIEGCLIAAIVALWRGGSIGWIFRGEGEGWELMLFFGQKDTL